MKILITGANGRLGSRIAQYLAHHPEHQTLPFSREHLDITDYAAVRALFGQTRPDWVIHAAAYTDVDGCAQDPQKAVTINGHGAGNVAAAAAEIGAGVAYISSNEVFDGRAGQAYREYDPTNPINPYGYSKWVGEQAVLRVNPRHLIIRTSWLFAHGGKNFIQSILNAARAQKPLRVVINEIANPTYTDDLARAVCDLVQIGRAGTYHLVNEGFTSRYGFARYALDRAGYASTPISKISAAEWPRPSTPPEFSPLENTAAALLGVKLRSWQAAVDAFLEHEGLLVSS